MKGGTFFNTIQHKPANTECTIDVKKSMTTSEEDL